MDKKDRPKRRAGGTRLKGVRIPIEQADRLYEAHWQLRKTEQAIILEALAEYLDNLNLDLEPKK